MNRCIFEAQRNDGLPAMAEQTQSGRVERSMVSRSLSGRTMIGILRTVVVPFLMLGLMLSSAAHADNVDKLIKQLQSGKDHKIRLSAAVSLGKLDDERAVEALIGALTDPDKNIRSVAATSLGKLITSSTPDSLRKQATEALTDTAAKDKDAFVKKQAGQALAAISSLGAKQGSIYVDVGVMTNKASSSDAIRTLMRKTVEKTLAKNASSMFTSWPGGKPPTAKQLKAQKAEAFHVDGTLVTLTTEAKGSTTLVSCKISMLIATYPKKSMFGFLDGGAKVQSDSSPKSVQYAQEDCVAAVVEDLVARKIIPTICQRSTTGCP